MLLINSFNVSSPSSLDSFVDSSLQIEWMQVGPDSIDVWVEAVCNFLAKHANLINELSFSVLISSFNIIHQLTRLKSFGIKIKEFYGVLSSMASLTILGLPVDFFFWQTFGR